MTASSDDCRQARMALGAEPQAMPPELAAHLETCAACTRFRAETLALDGRLRAALELPLASFRHPAPRNRRYALAASVLLAVTLAGGLLFFRAEPTLAADLVEHVGHESGSWELRRPLSADEVTAVLTQAGVQLDFSVPVVYASPCNFRGRQMPHLVVQTTSGPMTVMLLAGEKVAGRQEFSEDGYRGVLLPAGEGSVAVLSRDTAVPESLVASVVSAVRWR